MSNNQNPVRISDIAEALGLSKMTVSAVLNGKGDDLRISQATQNKIQRVAKAMGYLPNISARKFRTSQHSNIPQFTIFWAIDSHSSLIGRTIMGMERAIVEKKINIDLNLKPFPVNHLAETINNTGINMFNGAIISNASEKDLNDLKDMTNLFAPILLFNQKSDALSSVTCNHYESSFKTTEMLAKRGHKNVALICPRHITSTYNLIRDGFLDGCDEFSLTCSEKNFRFGEATKQAGSQITSEIFRSRDSYPTAIFYLHDIMATGGLNALRALNIQIPSDVEIFAFGDKRYCSCTYPELSSLEMPVEEMAEKSLSILYDIINNRAEAPVHHVLDNVFEYRATLPESGSFSAKGNS